MAEAGEDRRLALWDLRASQRTPLWRATGPESSPCPVLAVSAARRLLLLGSAAGKLWQASLGHASPPHWQLVGSKPACSLLSSKLHHGSLVIAASQTRH